MNARRAALLATRALEPIESTAEDRLAALRHERTLLAQYATTKGFVKLRERLRELDHAINLMTGLPLA